MLPGNAKNGPSTVTGPAHPAGLRGQYLPLSLILLAAAAVRLYHLGNQSFWYDELYSVWVSGLPLADLIPEAITSGHPPLYYLVTHFWLVPGSGDVWLRLFSSLAGLLVVWLAYLAGREVFSRQAGLWAAAFAAFSPLLVWYSREATMYSFFTALSLLSIYLLARCARRGGWKNWFSYTAATTAALLTSFLSPVLLLAQAPLYWLLRDGRRGQARHWFYSQAALVTVALAIVFLARTGPTEGWAAWTLPSVSQALNGVIRAPYVLAGGWVIEAAAGFPHPEMPDIPAWGLWLGAGLFLTVCAAVAAAAAGCRRFLMQKNTLAIAACTFILFAGPAVMLAAISRPASARFYVWAVPILFIVVAAAIVAMPVNARRVAGLLIIALLSFFTVWEVAYSPGLAGEWRGIFSAIEADAREGDVLACFPLHQCVVAANHYPPAPAGNPQERPDNLQAPAADQPAPTAAATMPITGGMPVSDSAAAYFLPPGESWAGYRTGYFGEVGKTPPLAGATLEERLKAETAGARRVWLVTEDESYGGHPSTEEILRFFDEGWRLAGYWPLPPHDLRLYERNTI